MLQMSNLDDLIFRSHVHIFSENNHRVVTRFQGNDVIQGCGNCVVRDSSMNNRIRRVFVTQRIIDAIEIGQQLDTVTCLESN